MANVRSGDCSPSKTFLEKTPTLCLMCALRMQTSRREKQNKTSRNALLVCPLILKGKWKFNITSKIVSVNLLSEINCRQIGSAVSPTVSNGYIGNFRAKTTRWRDVVNTPVIPNNFWMRWRDNDFNEMALSFGMIRWKLNAQLRSEPEQFNNIQSQMLETRWNDHSPSF